MKSGLLRTTGVRLGVVLLTPVLVMGLVVGLAVAATLRFTGLPEDAAFRVDGTVVTDAELQDRLEVLEALYGVAPPREAELQEQFRRDSAKAVVVSMVLDRAAREKGIVIADKAAHEALAALIDDGFPEGRKGFVQLLGTVGASEQDVLDELKRQEATTRLFDEIVSGPAAHPDVTDEEVRRYYDEHPDRFTQPETRHLRNIVVASREAADRVVADISGGADFADLARQVSLDGSTRDAGGDLGVVVRDVLADGYAQVAFSAPPGELFGPVESEHGWNVGQVLEVRPGGKQSFEQVKDQLRAALESKEKLDFWHRWITERIHEADVSYADEYRPANPDMTFPAAEAAPE